MWLFLSPAMFMNIRESEDGEYKNTSTDGEKKTLIIGFDPYHLQIFNANPASDFHAENHC